MKNINYLISLVIAIVLSTSSILAQGFSPSDVEDNTHTTSMFFGKKMFEGHILEHTLPKVTGSLGTFVTLCEGETINIGFPSVKLHGTLRSEGYEYSDTRDFHEYTRFASTDTMNMSYHHKFIRFYVTNDIGTAYSESALLEIFVDNDRIVKKWDDVLVYNDFAHEVVAYQWYVNDQLIVGGVYQYCLISPNLDGYYHIDLTLVDGTEVETCPLYVEGVKTAPAQIAAYPSPAVSNQPFNLDVEGLTNSNLEGAVLSVYEVSGRKVISNTNVSSSNTLSLPQGVYVARLQTKEGRVLTSKIMIGK